MKNLIYIASLALMLFTLSCVQSNIDDTPIPGDTEELVEITARITPYISTNVDTRANKTDAEKNINNTCLAVLRDNKCIDVRYSSTSNATFVIAKETLQDNDIFYIIANIDGDPTAEGSGIIKVGSSIEDLLNISTSVAKDVLFEPNSTNIDTWALPMAGFYKIADVDNLPGIVPVPLESLYAKMSFTIWSKPEQEAEGLDKASFYLEGIELHNVPKTIDFIGGVVGETDDSVEVFSDAIDGSYSLDPSSCFAQGNSRSATFTCYLPERFLHPETAAEEFTYPFGKIADLDDDEKKRYPQRYKPLLVEGRNASFVRFSGEYINHQGHNFTVSYDIYFGEDNYSNFDIVRNKQYNHEVTIKGISTNINETDNENSISIDHRVNVTRVEPIITNLRRETLLDSHFEVRPLRIRKNPDYKGSTDGASVKVEVSYKDQATSKWVGIERSFGDGVAPGSSATYLVENELPDNKKNAAGKRRYFTVGLSQSLQDPVTEIPVTDEGETVWIYVDEADPAYAGDDVRVATITVTYMLNGAPYGDPITYDLNQRELFKVVKDGHEYLIEYQEEYLHNYDADDSFGLTEYEGMEWGLNNMKISKNHPAILFGAGGWDTFTNTIRDAVMDYSPYYDFYLKRDIIQAHWSFSSSQPYSDLVHERQGYSFSKEIILATKASQYEIGVLALHEDPKSAVEYCYNKNKRNENGTISDSDIVWYLPAIDEIEEIVKSQYDGNYSYIRFADFRGKFYWSSQPAFINNYLDIKRSLGSRYGIYMIDNDERARATKVLFLGGDPNDDANYDVVPSDLTNMFGDEDDTTNSNNIFTNATLMAKKYIYVDYRDWLVTSWIELIEERDAANNQNFQRSNNSGSWNHTLITPVYEDGAKMRTEKARVRCVRKM